MPVRLVLLIVLSAAALAVVAWPGRSGRARLVWAALLAVLLAPSWWQEWRWLSTQSAAGDVVRQLSGRAEAGAHCQRFSETFLDSAAYQGFVAYNDDGTSSPTAWLTMQNCQRIRDWRAGGQAAPSQEQVAAVHVLTHEAAHVGGERSEAVAECTAMQWDARTARLLGATALQARALQVAYWTELYPRMSGAYRSGDCREDGPLDLTPGDGSWP